MSVFYIPNKPFSEIFNLTIYDLLQADPNALQIMIMAYKYLNNEYEQKIYQGEVEIEISNEITEKNEILNIYNMTVVNIPTNKPKQRIDHPDYVFATKQLK